MTIRDGKPGESWRATSVHDSAHWAEWKILTDAEMAEIAELGYDGPCAVARRFGRRLGFGNTEVFDAPDRFYAITRLSDKFFDKREETIWTKL